MAISGLVDTCSISTGDGWTEGDDKVSVAVRHRIEDLGKTIGTRLRFGGLNNVRHSHESLAYTHSLGAAPLAE